MADVILFLNEQFVKDNSPIDENVDDIIIRNAIREAQHSHILPLLGTGLYDEIITEITADNVSTENTTLLESHIEWALLYWTLYEAVDHLNYKFMNKAIMTRSSDEATPVGQDDVVRLMGRFKDKAEMYSERTTDFLRENQTDYPLFINAGSGIDTIHPNKTNYTTGWYLGGNGSNCGNDFYG